MYYLDTSLLIAALTNEARTEEMQQWLVTQPTEELAISDWVITEFSGALSIKARTEELSAEQCADIRSVFTSLVEESLTVLALSRLDFHIAAQLADHYATGLRSGDALHLAVAKNHGMRLCTLDKGLEKAAQALGVSTLLL
jgi:predicted nucleic acid-binding protein